MAGCAIGDTARVDRNVPIQIGYGTLTNVEKVQLESDVAKNSTIGAAASAALSGITTKIGEGSSQAMGYTVRAALGFGYDLHLVRGGKSTAAPFFHAGIGSDLRGR